MNSDFFNVKGLEVRTGIRESYWDLVILKELMDNALDAIEDREDVKEITVTATENLFQIFDNGDGLSSNTIKNSIYDFNKYTTSKRNNINATRGKLGNGLKTIIGICYLNKYRMRWHTNEGIV